MEKAIIFSVLAGLMQLTANTQFYTETDAFARLSDSFFNTPIFCFLEDTSFSQETPGFFEKYKLHLLAITAIYILLTIIISQRIRLHMQKQKMQKNVYEAALLAEKLNQKFRLILKASQTTAWVWDLQKQEIECDREYLPENGPIDDRKYTVTESSFYSRMHPDYVEKIKKAYECLINNGCAMFHQEIRMRLFYEQDVYNWVECYAIVGERDVEGKAISIVGGLAVITERKRMEEELKIKEQEEKANQLKSAFLANISHEVRTPLNAIVGFSELIAEGTCAPDEVHEYCRIIELNNTLLLKLIDDVLELSKIDSGEIELDSSDILVSDVVLELIGKYKTKVREGVSLHYNLPEQSCLAYSDKERLVQVLNNLLSNACKFTSVGMIEVGYKPTKDGLYFYVSDTGKGISEENKQHVFDRFSKFDSFIQGTGLGLSVSQALIYKMNGQIGVESELGKGSTFWFTIPCEVALPLLT